MIHDSKRFTEAEQCHVQLTDEQWRVLYNEGEAALNRMIAQDVAQVEIMLTQWKGLAKAREEAKLAEQTGCLYCPHSEFSFNFITCTLAIGERLLSDEEDSIARNGGVPDWCPLVEEAKLSPLSPSIATPDTA